MPTWMNCLFKKFGSNETILNVKIFILKLIINVPKVCNCQRIVLPL